MVDINDAAVQRGLKTVSDSLERLVRKDKMTPEAKARCWPASGSTSQAALKPAATW
jgi:3-hydroxybutyryl-CoA dehydrogenase